MKQIIVMVAALSVGLSACATDPYTGETRVSKTAIGMATGAAAGAAVGVIAGDSTKATLIGAASGAAVGGGIGGYMDYQNKKLREELVNTGVQVEKEGNNIRLIMPGNITFDTNVSAIRADFYPVLDAVAKVLIEYKKTLVNVTGHTDSTGADATNQRLSQERAQSVASYLINRKVGAERFTVQGMSSRQPIASNATAAGRTQNRRVEILLIPMTN
jgi:outer membrane protein OmpA-like peptidoglycan-associated protein